MGTRTSIAEKEQEGVEALADTLRHATGSFARSVSVRPSRDIDILVNLADGRTLVGEVKAAAHAEPARIAKALPEWTAELERLRSDTRDHAGTFAVLVADAIPDATRALLRDAGWSWLDRRGHLFLQAPGLLINDNAVEPHPRAAPTAGRSAPINGRAGLAAAAALLIRPEEPPGVRELAREGGLAPSTISAAMKSLRDSSLIDQRGRPLIPEMFWALADAWAPDRVALASAPIPGRATRLGLNLGHLDQPGWATSGTLAASAWGAPVPVRSGFPPDFYVPSPRQARAASRQLHAAANWEDRGCTVAVAPVPQVVLPRYDAESLAAPWLEWPLTHPLFVALDLAQDRSRGVEILSGWTPPSEFRRVW
jgi:hypothetical protein